MPKALERKLKAKAAKKFPGNEKRQDAYVYGTMRATGWKPKRERGKRKKMHIKGASVHPVITTPSKTQVLPAPDSFLKYC